MAKAIATRTTVCSRCGKLLEVPERITGNWSAVCLDCLAQRGIVVAAKRRKAATAATKKPKGGPSVQLDPDTE
jgi:hypothetical protein